MELLVEALSNIAFVKQKIHRTCFRKIMENFNQCSRRVGKVLLLVGWVQVQLFRLACQGNRTINLYCL